LDSFTPQRDQNWIEAGQLMKEAGVPAENHSLMRENIATYLSHRMSKTPSRRWRVKIDRDLAKPYSNDRVFERLDELQSALGNRLAESGAMPSKLYITGSFAKGRFSPHDDLDTLNVVSEQQYDTVLQEAVLRRQQKDIHFFPLREDQTHTNRGMLMVDGVSQAVDTKVALEPGFLKRTYLENLNKKTQARREVQPLLEKWIGKAHRSRYDSTSIHSRLMRTAVASLGLASQVPLVGPLVERSFNLLVAQQHSTN